MQILQEVYRQNKRGSDDNHNTYIFYIFCDGANL